nr:uncharacterized protein LOC128687882 [Cherax quadricarinatus]
MASVLLRACAMPFGFTSDMIDSDFTYEGECIFTDEMNWRTIQRSRGLAPLPDVILSNTPPPSPLRRAHSYLSFFPEKTIHTLSTSNLALDTPPPTPTPEACRSTRTRAASFGNLVNWEENLKVGLKHIREVRRRLHSEHPQHNPQHSLPQLSWPLPRPHRCPNTPHHRPNIPPHHPNHFYYSQGQGESTQGEREEEDRCRKAGRELRKIADNFQLNSAKVATKRSNDASFNLAVPTALTKCITASLLCLIWWRLVNRLR